MMPKVVTRASPTCKALKVVCKLDSPFLRLQVFAAGGQHAVFLDDIFDDTLNILKHDSYTIGQKSRANSKTDVSDTCLKDVIPAHRGQGMSGGSRVLKFKPDDTSARRET